jgi:hypothetical protein
MAWVEYRIAPLAEGGDVLEFLAEWDEHGWHPDGPPVAGRDMQGQEALMYTMRRTLA